MKLPTAVYSHCLAHGPSITPDNLQACLEADKKLGYRGMVIVPAMIQPGFTPEAVAQVFRDMQMHGLVCGLNAGKGIDPLIGDGWQACLSHLRKQAQYAIALADRGCGPNMMVGPMHTHHMNPRKGGWPEDGFMRWMDKLHAMAIELGIELLFEPLNSTEDRTHDVFQTLWRAVRDREMFGLHWDTSHAFDRNMTPNDMRKMAPKIGFLEFANVDRWPLDMSMGISFLNYVSAMVNLPESCRVGVEPFDPTVIRAFGLGQLYATNVSGAECLARDFLTLGRQGVVS